jgi:Stress responsive A/B Barrel Domain
VIRHVVIRELTEGTTPEQIALMEENTRAFAQIPGIRRVETGRNLNLVPRSEGYDHLTIIDMDGPEVLPSFVAHPLHGTAADFSKGLTARAMIFDLELS